MFPTKKEFDSFLAEKSYFLSIHIRFAKNISNLKEETDYDDQNYGKRVC